MNEGDVVIIAMPQADGSTKNRPTVILREMPPFQDMMVCGISTQLRQKVKILTKSSHRRILISKQVV